MKDYASNEFWELGVTEIFVTPSIGYCKPTKSIPPEKYIIEFKQSIIHKDNPNPSPVIGNSITTSEIKHRIVEVDTIEEGMKKVEEVAKRALKMIPGDK